MGVGGDPEPPSYPFDSDVRLDMVEMHRYRFKIVIAAAFVLAVGRPQRLLAQSEDGQDFRSSARFHVGPVYVNPSLQLKELGIDTNVFNTADDPRSDFTTTIEPQATAWLPISHRFTLQGTGGVDLVYYAVYANQRSISGNYAVQGTVTLHRLSFFASDRLLNTRDRPSNEIDIRPRHLEHNTTVGVAYQLHKKLDFRMTAGHTALRYDESLIYQGVNLADALDHDTESVGADIGFRLTPYTTIGARGDWFQDRFVTSQGRDGDSLRLMPYVSFSPRALIKGTASVGLRRFEPQSPQVPPFQGLAAEANVSIAATPGTILGVTANRDLSYSFEAVTPYYIINGIGASVRRQLVGRYDATVGADRSTYNYQHLTGTGISIADDRRDVTTEYTVDLGYHANRKTRIAVGVASFHRRSTQQSQRDYDSLRIRSTATVAF